MNEDSSMQVADRVRQAFKGAGARQIARESGVPVGTVQSILNGTVPRVDTLSALARASGTTLDWLASGDERNIHMTLADLQHAIEDRDEVHIPRYDVALSAGHGSFVDHAAFRELVPFNASYISQRLRRDPQHLVLVEVRGDSMEPTVSDRDLVMVDTSDTALAPGIWALVIEDAVMVKRLNPTLGGVEVISDNPIYGRQLVGQDQQDTIRLVGRVVWVARVLGRAPAPADQLDPEPLDPAQSVPFGAQISSASRAFRPKSPAPVEGPNLRSPKEKPPRRPPRRKSHSDHPPTGPRGGGA